MKTKTIGITCDVWKALIFRKGLKKDGFNIVYDNGAKGLHLFKIECNEQNFDEVKNKLKKTLKRLELEVKRSN